MAIIPKQWSCFFLTAAPVFTPHLLDQQAEALFMGSELLFPGYNGGRHQHELPLSTTLELSCYLFTVLLFLQQAKPLVQIRTY